MTNNKQHPLTEITDEQLDQLIQDLDIPYSEKNQQQILKMTQQKAHKKTFRRFKKRTQVLLAVAATLVLVPTGAFAANKIWEMVTNRDGFLTPLRFDADQVSDTPYKLNVGYVPTNLEQFQELKYQEKGQQAQGGFSLSLIKPTEKNSFEVPYSTGAKEVKIGEHKVYLVERTGNYREMTTIAYVLFEKENRVVQAYFDKKIDQAEQLKILAGLTLIKTTEKKATTTYDMAQKVEESDWQEQPLKLISPRIHKVGDTFTASYDGQEQAVKIKADSLKTFTSIPNYQNNVSDYSGDIEQLSEAELLGKNGQLKTFEADVFQKATSKKALDKQITSLKLQPIYLQLTLEVTNQTKKDFDEFYFAPTLQSMNKDKKGYTHNFGNIYTTPISFGDEVVYNNHHGEGKAYNNIGPLKAGETKTVELGYLTTDPAVTSQLLEFNLDGVGKENLNDFAFSWLQID